MKTKNKLWLGRDRDGYVLIRSPKRPSFHPNLEFHGFDHDHITDSAGLGGLSNADFESSTGIQLNVGDVKVAKISVQ